MNSKGLCVLALLALTSAAQAQAPALTDSQLWEVASFNQLVDAYRVHLRDVSNDNSRGQLARDAVAMLGILPELRKEAEEFLASRLAGRSTRMEVALMEFSKNLKAKNHEELGAKFRALSAAIGLYQARLTCHALGGSYKPTWDGKSPCTLANPVADANRKISSGVLPAGYRHGPMVRDSGAIQDAGAPK